MSDETKPRPQRGDILGSRNNPVHVGNCGAIHPGPGYEPIRVEVLPGGGVAITGARDAAVRHDPESGMILTVFAKPVKRELKK